jgi:hypothetical protein
MANKGKLKKPVLPDYVKTAKTPRFLGSPNIENTHLAWRFSRADIGGPYNCSDLSHEEFKQMWDRLRAFEKMNVSEMRADGSFHPKAISELQREQQERLRQIELDDVELLYSFRITGTCRLWCMKYENILLVLWWDKDHQVVPVSKRHT